MADTIKTSSELKIETYYSDADTRTITIDNPKDNLTKADIKAVETVGVNTQVLLGDKGGAGFVRFNKAKTTKTTRTELDLR